MCWPARAGRQLSAGSSSARPSRPRGASVRCPRPVRGRIAGQVAVRDLVVEGPLAVLHNLDQVSAGGPLPPSGA